MTTIFNSIRAVRGLIAAGLLAGTASIAHAEAPEQIYEPAPAAGHSRFEYNGQFLSSRGGHRPHNVEFYHGVSDRLALGLAIEGEASHGDFEVEQFGAGAIFDLVEEAPVELSLFVEAAVTTEGEFPQLQARLIAKSEFNHWRALGNLIVKRRDKDHEEGSTLGFSALLDHEVAEHVHLGVETSGQIARLSGLAHAHYESAQYAGPSLTFGFELPHHQELEVGVKYLRRLDSDQEYRDTVRVAVGFHF